MLKEQDVLDTVARWLGWVTTDDGEWMRPNPDTFHPTLKYVLISKSEMRSFFLIGGAERHIVDRLRAVNKDDPNRHIIMGLSCNDLCHCTLVDIVAPQNITSVQGPTLVHVMTFAVYHAVADGKLGS